MKLTDELRLRLGGYGVQVELISTDQKGYNIYLQTDIPVPQEVQKELDDLVAHEGMKLNFKTP